MDLFASVEVEEPAFAAAAARLTEELEALG